MFVETGLFQAVTRFFREVRPGPMAAAPAEAVTWSSRFRLDYLRALPASHLGRSRTLYRGDSRDPGVVFTEGFRPSGGHGRVVYASPRLITAERTPRGRGSVYEIQAPGGTRPTGQLRSVRFVEGIDARYVKAHLAPDGTRTPNPGFDPR
jgi:hypothetical protein